MKSQFPIYNQHRLYKVQKFTDATLTQWKHKTDLEYGQIWENTSDLSIAEAYPIYNPTHLQIHAQRYTQNVINVSGFCESQQNKIFILAERVISRLSDCHILNESQALKILYAIFKGLEELVPMFGIIGIDETCVCFTDEGHIKIWINPNQASITPIQNFNNSSPGAQKIVIWETIEMIKKKCFNQKIFMHLKNGIEAGKIKVYSQVYREVFKIAENLFIDITEKQSYHLNAPLLRHKSSFSSHSAYQFSQSNFSAYNYSTAASPLKSNTFSDFSPRIGFPTPELGNNTEIPLTDRSKNSVQTDGFEVQKKSRAYGFSERVNKHKRHRSTVQNSDAPQKLNVCPSTNNIHLSIHEKQSNIKFERLNENRQDHTYSAPISPRDKTQKNFKKKTWQQNIQEIQLDSPKFTEEEAYEQRTSNKRQRITKKEQQQDFYKLSQSQKQKEIEESFASKFRLQQKQDIQVKGDFQTFGLLDALSEKKLDRSENSCFLDRSGSNCFMDLDIEGMDREIIKKLQKKKMDKVRRNSNKKVSIEIFNQLEPTQNYNQLEGQANKLSCISELSSEEHPQQDNHRRQQQNVFKKQDVRAKKSVFHQKSNGYVPKILTSNFVPQANKFKQNIIPFYRSQAGRVGGQPKSLSGHISQIKPVSEKKSFYKL